MSDISELARIGAKIVELGGQLKQLKADKSEIEVAIAKIEEELRPLVVEHAKLVAEAVGGTVSLPPPTPTKGPPIPEQTVVSDSPAPTPQTNNGEIKKRILQYLQRAEPGTSAGDIAEALRLDPLVVRSVMSDIARQGRSQPGSQD